MRSAYSKSLLILLILSVILTACGPGQILGPTLTSTPTNTPKATSTPKPTSTPRPTKTPKVVDTLPPPPPTAPPADSQAVTITPLPTNTFVPVATATVLKCANGAPKEDFSLSIVNKTNKIKKITVDGQSQILYPNAKLFYYLTAKGIHKVQVGTKTYTYKDQAACSTVSISITS